MELCKCHNPPILYSDYTENYIGTDETKGRFGEVTINKCNYCNSFWLHYLVEYEYRSGSGRWYRGLITEKDLKNITPENSIDYLKSIDWFLYGGSYFQTTGRRGSGDIFVD